MGRPSMHPRWALFFPFGGRVGAVIFYFSSFFLLPSSLLGFDLGQQPVIGFD